MKNFLNASPGRSCDEPGALWDLFHENSKLLQAWQPYQRLRSEEIESLLVRELEYSGSPVIGLKEPKPAHGEIDELLSRRRSERDLGSGALALTEVGDLLANAMGVRKGLTPRDDRRAYPSGGALYPVELFVIARRVDGLSRDSVYYYAARAHEFRRLPRTARPIEADFVEGSPVDCAAVVLLVGCFDRSVAKYGDRGYRLALLEAGHLAQNLVLVSTAFGLACCPLASFFDHEIDERLGLDGVGASCIYAVALGAAEARSL